MSFDHELSDEDIAESELRREDFDRSAQQLADAFTRAAANIQPAPAMSETADGPRQNANRRDGLAKRLPAPRRWVYLGGVAAALMLVVAGVAVGANTNDEEKLDASPGTADIASDPTKTPSGDTPTSTPRTSNPTEDSSQPPPTNDSTTFDFSDPSSLDASFDVGLYHRDDAVVAQDGWPGDYASTGDGTCSDREQKRQIGRGDRASGFNQDWIYQCDVVGSGEQLLVTSIGDTSGYSIGAFSPKDSYTGITEIRWEVTITDLGNRQWTEVAVIPENNVDFQNLPCSIDWLPCDTTTHQALDSVGVSFFQQQMWINPAQASAVDVSDAGWSDLHPSDPASATDGSTRRTHVLRQDVDVDGEPVLTFGIERADGTFFERSTPGTFPDGPVRVVFSDHNFTPLKSESTTPRAFSWQWDNIVIS